MAVQAIGQRVRREEDFRLLTGRGRYVDDVPAIGALRGYVLRSPHAHARVTSIDADEAKTKGWVSTVGFGVGIVGVGAGIILLATGSKGSTRASATADGLRLRF